jgi:hypothetical protein
MTLDAIGRLVYAVRGATQGSIVFDYRGAVPDTGASTVCRLGDTPIAARDLVLSRLKDPASARPAVPPGPANGTLLVRRA